MAAAPTAPTAPAAPRGSIQTLRGALAPDELTGHALMHEHIFIDFKHFYRQPEGDEAHLGDAKIALDNVHWVQYHVVRNKHNLTLEDEADAVAELARFKGAGGALVVDATTHGIGRDPVRVADVSARTGLHVVAGAGFYVGATQTQAVQDMSVHQLEELMVKEVEEGIGNTGLRAGIVGEIGTSWPITPSERNVLMAAARAAKRTGTMLNVHPGRHDDAPLACLAVVRDAAGPEQLNRTVISHIDRTLFSTQQHLAVAATGATLEFDLFGMEISNYPLGHSKRNVSMPNDGQRMEWVSALLQHGHIKQVLLSHDIYSKHRLHRYGGHGYDHISRNILPRLRNYEITDDQIEQIMVRNPRALLTKM